MENIAVKSICIVEASYRNLRTSVFQYIYYKIGNREEAEDLVQDTFVRLMEYKQMLCEETVNCFIFTIARNLVTDYLRRHYKKQEIDCYLIETTITSSNETESRIMANDLAEHEMNRIQLLPPQRRTIYWLSRFEGMAVADISARLDLSLRTVENHLRLGRKDVRTYMKLCV